MQRQMREESEAQNISTQYNDVLRSTAHPQPRTYANAGQCHNFFDPSNGGAHPCSKDPREHWSTLLTKGNSSIAYFWMRWNATNIPPTACESRQEDAVSVTMNVEGEDLPIPQTHKESVHGHWDVPCEHISRPPSCDCSVCCESATAMIREDKLLNLLKTC